MKRFTGVICVAMGLIALSMTSGCAWTPQEWAAFNQAMANMNQSMSNTNMNLQNQINQNNMNLRNINRNFQLQKPTPGNIQWRNIQ